MNRLDMIEKPQMRADIPAMEPGDTVRVHVRIKESETKERLQVFEGVVIALKGGGASGRSRRGGRRAKSPARAGHETPAGACNAGSRAAQRRTTR